MTTNEEAAERIRRESAAQRRWIDHLVEDARQRAERRESVLKQIRVPVAPRVEPHVVTASELARRVAERAQKAKELDEALARARGRR